MKKRTWKKIGWVLLLFFLLGNVVIYNHAYQFTHFADSSLEKTKKPEDLKFFQKLKILFSGISVPKPSNQYTPSVAYETFFIQSHETLEAWNIDVPNRKGIVILFHGYSSSKDDLLPYSTAFNKKGYSTVLVDFMGSGGSSGNTTTIGFKEGRDVKEVFNIVKNKYPKDEIILFGPSMGAVSIMKAIEQFNLKPDKIILECPFGSMIATTKIRFEAMNLPSFPFAHMILFYGGIQNGFNAFQHKPTEYAKEISVPTLLLYGAKDERVNKSEVEEIYQNLAGKKEFVILEKSAHEIYLNDDAQKWNEVIDHFLNQ